MVFIEESIMQKRIISNSMRKWLAGEMEVWVNGDILSSEQRSNIEDIYETREATSTRKHSLAIFTLMGIAAAFIGLGSLLLVGYNWEVMPKALKLVVLFGIFSGTYGLAFWLRTHPARKQFSEIAFLMGNIFYGVTIWQIAQIFHIQSHYPNGLWIWALGILPFALCLDTLLLHILLTAVLAIWVGTEILGFGHLGLWFFGWRQYLANGAYTLPLFAAAGMIWAYRKHSPIAIGLYALLAGWWMILQPVAWECHMNPVYFLGTLAGLFLLTAECHPNGSELAVPFRVFGVLMAVGTLIPLGFYDFHRFELTRNLEKSGVIAGALIALGSVLAAVVAELLKKRYWENAKSVPFQAVIQRQWMPLGMMLFMGAMCLWYSAAGSGPRGNDIHRYSPYWEHLSNREIFIPVLVANAMMLIFSIWMIRTGLREERGGLFAGGVIFMLAVAVMRYIDLFGPAGGMLGAAAMFFLCGAFLFGIARYWQIRKRNSLL
jgi:uncharacterized membrane protein